MCTKERTPPAARRPGSGRALTFAGGGAPADGGRAGGAGLAVGGGVGGGAPGGEEAELAGPALRAAKAWLAEGCSGQEGARGVGRGWWRL